MSSVNQLWLKMLYKQPTNPCLISPKHFVFSPTSHVLSFISVLLSSAQSPLTSLASPLVRRMLLLALLLPTARATTYTNPVLATNTPDPGVLALSSGGWAIVATSDHATSPTTQPALPLYYSPDLISWQPQGHVFPAGAWPVWAVKNMWAPEIHFVGGRHLVYFSGSAPNGRHSIGVAVSTTESPFGPYEDLGTPLVYHNEDSIVGPIDQNYFLDPSTGRHYLLWKTDHLVGLHISSVVIQKLRKDGLGFVEGSSPQQIMEDDDLPNEQRIVEGPWMMYKDGAYFLFYSSSLFQLPSYHVGVGRASHLLGPYTKAASPVVQTDWEKYHAGENCTWEGPGHGSVVEDAAGHWWLLYHSWAFGHLDREPGRLLLLDRLTWQGFPSTELWPRVEGGVPSDTEREGPRVEGGVPSDTEREGPQA